MNKKTLFYGLLLGLAALPWGFAQTSMNTPLPAAAQVGVIAAARGTVEIASSEKVGRVVQSGEPVYLGDEVRTDDKGQLQILLMDESVFTIGPNSRIVIDEFVYDPQTHDGKVAASILAGAFREVTGKIGKKNPKNVEIKLPAGSVGIRGTIFCGQVNGFHSEILLLGPGDKTTSGEHVGAIAVSNEVDGETVSVDVTKAGYGTVIEGLNVPPTPAFEFPAERIQEMISPLMVQEEKKEPQQDGAKSESARDTKAETRKADDGSKDTSRTAANKAPDGRDSSGSMASSTKAPADMRTTDMKAPETMDSTRMTDTTTDMKDSGTSSLGEMDMPETRADYTEDSFEGGLGGEEAFKMDSGDLSKDYRASSDAFDTSSSTRQIDQMTVDLEKDIRESSHDAANADLRKQYMETSVQPSPTPSVSISI
jgi:hypothetical protein